MAANADRGVELTAIKCACLMMVFTAHISILSHMEEQSILSQEWSTLFFQNGNL